MVFDSEYIRFDWAIKNYLRDKSNFTILEGLISVLIDKDVKIIEILESEGNQDSKDDKYNKVDIKARNSDGHIILVEVQLTTQLHYLQRILYGTSKTITDHIKLGDTYSKVSKVYSISLLYCDFGEGDDYIYKGETVFKGIHTGNSLVVKTKENGVIKTLLPREVFPEYYLVRLNAFDKTPASPLEEWMDYLKNGHIDDNTKIPGLIEVMEKMRILSMSKTEQEAYFNHVDSMMQQNDAYDTAIEEGKELGKMIGLQEGRKEGLQEGRKEGLQEGRKEGLQEGRKEGLEEAKLTIAKELKGKGMSKELIISVTHISESEYESI